MSRALFLLTFVLTAKAFVIEEIVPRRRVIAQIGDELNLVCRTRGCASPTFVWSTLLDNPLGGTVRLEGNSSVLSMEVGFVNENDYRCTAFCGEEKKQRTAKVEIYSFPSDPVIEINGQLELGKPAMVTCTVPNVYPSDRLVISLEKEGKSLGLKDFSQDPFTKSLQTKSMAFAFIPAEEDIGKTITCVAELSMEKSKQRETTQTLSVTYAPRSLNFAMLPSAEVQEGESVTLQCSANSSPTARFVIKRKLAEKDEVLESQNGSVHILKVTPDDSGEYECEAENGVGNVKTTAMLSVTFQPRNTTIITSPSNTVKEGEAVTLICSSYGNPLPSIFWKKQLANGTSQLIKEGATFILKDVRADDEGHYECEAVNSAGKETKAVELIVQVLSPTTPALTDQPETTTELVDFTTESPSYTTEPQKDNDDETHTEDEWLPFTKTATFTAPKNDTVTSPEKMFDVINPTEEMKVVIARIEEPDYMIPVIIVASTLATAAGPITAALIYACRRSKVNGSYSPVVSEV